MVGSWMVGERKTQRYPAKRDELMKTANIGKVSNSELARIREAYCKHA